MNFRTERRRLTDIADVERAVKDRVYPAGTIFIQVSATHGQIHMLATPSKLESKFATIIPKNNVYPPYFKIAIERCVPEFLARFQTTINIQMGEFHNFMVEIHSDYETQVSIATLMREFEQVEHIEEQIIDALKDIKRIGLARMMV